MNQSHPIHPFDRSVEEYSISFEDIPRGQCLEPMVQEQPHEDPLVACSLDIPRMMDHYQQHELIIIIIIIIIIYNL